MNEFMHRPSKPLPTFANVNELNGNEYNEKHRSESPLGLGPQATFNNSSMVNNRYSPATGEMEIQKGEYFIG